MHVHGLLGRACTRAIEPFRHAVEHSALLSGVERRRRTTHLA